jgi:hypothetical protein
LDFAGLHRKVEGQAILAVGQGIGLFLG